MSNINALDFDKNKNSNGNKNSTVDNGKVEDKNEQYNFKPDLWFKYAFENMSKQSLVNILNYLFEMNLDYNTEFEFIKTDFVNVNRIDDDLYVRIADIIIKDITNNKKYHIEFQSTKMDEMALRLFEYSLDIAKRDLENSRYKNSLKFCKSSVIYTQLPYVNENRIGNYSEYGDYEREVGEGYKTMYLNFSKFRFRGQEYIDESIEIDYHFINLLHYDEYQLLNSSLDVLSVVSFYSALKKDNFFKTDEIAINFYNRMRDYIQSVSNVLSKENIDIVRNALQSICKDCIIKMTKADNISREVVNMYSDEEKTLGEMIKEQGRQEGMNDSIISIMKTYINLKTTMDDIYRYMKGGFNMDKETTDEYYKYVLQNMSNL